MEAKVKPDSRVKVVTCAGFHFNKMGWLPVPAGSEGEAKKNPYLMTRETGEAEPIPIEAEGTGPEASSVVEAELPEEDPAPDSGDSPQEEIEDDKEADAPTPKPRTRSKKQ